MHISNVNSSEPKCDKILTSVMQEVSLHLKNKKGKKRKNPKQLLKYQDEKTSFNIKA